MTLRSWLVVIAALVFGAAMLVLAVVAERGIETYSGAASGSAVLARGQALSSFLSHTLNTDWEGVQEAALQIDASAAPEILRTAVSFLAGAHDKARWVGIARIDGTVVAGSNGAREGTNVAGSTWFQRGLQGPFAADVPGSAVVDPLSNEQVRSVEFSAPVYTPEGAVFGVLGFQLNWQWVRDFLIEEAGELNVDAFVVNRDGTIVLGTDQYTAETARLPSFQAAALQAEGMFHEVWPDGNSYFAATFPERAYETLPPFGWSLVVRLDPNFVRAAEREFRNWMWAWTAGVFVVAVSLMGVLSGVLLRPLKHLAQALLDVAKGEPAPYLREYRRFSEVTKLSEAMVRLQSGQHGPETAKKDAVGEPPVSDPSR